MTEIIKTYETLRAENERLRAERDEWQAKWIALAQGRDFIVGGSDEQEVGEKK